MSRRARISYPTGNLQSRVVAKHHVGEIVFVPFIINVDLPSATGDDEWEIVPSHAGVYCNRDGNGMIIPKSILL